MSTGPSILQRRNAYGSIDAPNVAVDVDVITASSATARPTSTFVPSFLQQSASTIGLALLLWIAFASMNVIFSLRDNDASDGQSMFGGMLDQHSMKQKRISYSKIASDARAILNGKLAGTTLKHKPASGSPHQHLQMSQLDPNGDQQGHPTEGCEGTVLISRHCEKGDIYEHCDYLGFERAVYLASLFGDEKERWPSPSYIFALNPGGRNKKKKRNHREVESVEPLSRKTGVDINSEFKTDDEIAQRVFELLWEGKMCGKLAVISWKHSHIPHLAHSLACSSDEGCPLKYPSFSFDQIFQIKYRLTPNIKAENKHIGLKKRDPEWQVFGTVLQQDFDPLHFSKISKDYPKGGTAQGGNWMKAAHESLHGNVMEV